MKLISRTKHLKTKTTNASLTVEASLVMPLFLLVFVSFLYFIQIITFQEELQKAMTETGLSIARAAYIYSDFYDVGDAENFDFSLLEGGIEIGLEEITGAIINNVVLKYSVESRLNKDSFIFSCIIGGLDSIRYDASKLFQDKDDIEIVAKYQVRNPIMLFGLQEMEMIQGVKLRGWNGYQLPPLYTIIEREDDEKEKIVYITESGTVYHLSRTCSHISLSVELVIGKPTNRRNKNGGKYYACESCCTSKESEFETFYITSYGTRYHMDKDCSKIKRTVKEVPLSKVGDKVACKRCGR